MARQWIVLVEATEVTGSGAVERGDVARLLAAVDRSAGGNGGGALQSSDRYVLQLTTAASGPAEALAGVLSSWAAALTELNLPTWQIVRTEVLTPEELARDEQRHLRDDLPVETCAAAAGPRRQECPRPRGFRPRLL